MFNFGLDDTFSAQQQQADQARLLTDDQFKLISQLYDPKESLAYQKAAADTASSAPKLQFGGGTFVEGLGNGINNYQAMKGFNQQRQAYQDLATQQQAYQQKQIELVNQQIQAQQARETEALSYLEQVDPRLAALYRVSPSAQRASILATAATHQGDVTYKPQEIVAQETGERLAREAKRIELGPQPLETKGIPNAQRLTRYQEIFGKLPVTTVNVNKDVIGAQQAQANLQETKNRLGAQPTKLQQEIDLNDLNIAFKKVEAAFAQQEKELKVKLDTIKNKQGSLDYKKGLEEYKRFQQGQELFNQLQENGALNSTDPKVQAQHQARLGMLGVKYNPPNSSYTTIKRKDGTMWLLDKNTNQLGKIEADGTVKQWQELKE